MNDKKPIILDFTRKDFSDAIICDDENLLHRAKLDEAMLMWRDLYKKAIEESEEKDFCKPNIVHDTISLFGSRGAGKTTFLLTFVDRIKREYPDVLCLEHIDPSLIEPKLHPFVSILASLHREVERSGMITECDSCDQRFDKYRSYTQLYTQLLKSLPSIDGVGKDNLYENWVDNEYVAQKGMQRAEIYNQLDILFNRYVKLTLELMGKKVLVIPFDDIDTDFHKGFEILEVIRKYLINRQIVSILTGDMELYAKLVRQASWQCFTPDYLKSEIEYSGYKGRDFANMVDQLEDQYLVKILKPERRIQLKTLGEYLEDGYDIRVRFNEGSDIPSVQECYNDIIKLSGIKSTNRSVVKVVKSFLQGQSLRIQIRLLTCLKRCNENQHYQTLMANYLLSVFWNDITQKTPASKALFKESGEFVTDMLQFLLRTNSLFTCTKFLPTTNDDALNKSLFSIGAFFNKQVSKEFKSYMVIDYWIRIAMNQTLLSNLSNKAARDEGNLFLNEFIDYTNMCSDVELTKGLGLAFAFANGKYNEIPDNINPYRASESFLAATIQIPQKHYDYKIVNDRLTTMAMLGTIRDEVSENVLVSIFKILASIHDIMVVIDNAKKSEDSEIKKTINLQFNRFCQYLYYKEPAPSVRLTQQDARIDEYKYERDIQPEIESLDDGFIADIIRWASIRISPSCELLERIYTRFYFSCLNIDASNYHMNTAEKLSAYIVALFNAALVEETIDASIGNITFNSIGDINELYISNLYQFREKSKNVTLEIHNWLISCPLLLVYLRKEIYDLIMSENIPIADVINSMRYERLLNDKEAAEQQLERLNVESDNCTLALLWFHNFRKLVHLREDIGILRNQLKNKGLEPETINTLRQEYDQARRVHDNLEAKLAVGVFIPSLGIKINYKMDYNEIDRAYIDLMTRMNNITKKKDEIQERISKISSYMKQFPRNSLPGISTRKYDAYSVLKNIVVL